MVVGMAVAVAIANPTSVGKLTLSQVGGMVGEGELLCLKVSVGQMAKTGSSLAVEKLASKER